ncbi:L,D-transpeptidase [bacterium]|nr:L,D-transpeptidase [bacterium]
MQSGCHVLVSFVICLFGQTLLARGIAPDSCGQNRDVCIRIEVRTQSLSLVLGDSLLAVYPVSTSIFGTGSLMNSNKTPLGRHRICEKIGKLAAEGTVFKSRVSTGRIAVIYTDSTDIGDDLITSRILRLEGCEDGRNRGGDVDSRERCIYIHGTQEEGLIGTPASHGCIRMKNRDIISLFNRVEIGTLVDIVE